MEGLSRDGGGERERVMRMGHDRKSVREGESKTSVRLGSVNNGLA